MTEFLKKNRAIAALLAAALAIFGGARVYHRAQAEHDKVEALAELHRFATLHAATGNNAAGWKIDTTTGDLITPSGKYIEGLASHQGVAAVCTSNVALSGLATTCDGVAISSGNLRVLATNQTTATNIGCWVSAAGAWARCADFAAGASASGNYFPAYAGTSNKGNWVFTNAPGADVVGTNTLTSVNVSSGGGGGGQTFPPSNDLPMANFDLTGMRDPVAAQEGATKAYVDNKTPSVVGMFTVSPPSYTYVAGVITANANGAFPVLDSNVAANVGDAFYLPPSVAGAPADGGLYTLTAAGSVGATWSATRWTGMDQAAEFVGSAFRVRGGVVGNGAQYYYSGPSSFTVGTTAPAWLRADGLNDMVEWVWAANTDLIWGGVPTTGTVNHDGFTFSCSTGGSFVSQTQTNTEIGWVTAHTGATATNACGFQRPFSAYLSANDAVLIDVKWQLTQAPAATYCTNVGFADTQSCTVTNGINASVDQANNGSANIFLNVCASTCTRNDSGLAAASATWYHTVILKNKFSSTTTMWTNGGNVITDSGAHIPTGVALSELVTSAKTSGAGDIQFSADWIKMGIGKTTRRAQ